MKMQGDVSEWVERDACAGKVAIHLAREG